MNALLLALALASAPPFNMTYPPSLPVTGGTVQGSVSLDGGNLHVNGELHHYVYGTRPDGGPGWVEWWNIVDGQVWQAGALTINGRTTPGATVTANNMQYQFGIYSDTDSPTIVLRTGLATGEGVSSSSIIDVIDYGNRWAWDLGGAGDMHWGAQPIANPDGGIIPYGFDTALERESAGLLKVTGGIHTTSPVVKFGDPGARCDVRTYGDLYCTSIGSFSGTVYANGFDANGYSSVFGPIKGTAQTLDTCNAGNVGKIEMDSVGGSSSHPTRYCLCQSDGAGSPTYAWRNIITGTTGNTTTCAD